MATPNNKIFQAQAAEKTSQWEAFEARRWVWTAGGDQALPHPVGLTRGSLSAYLHMLALARLETRDPGIQPAKRAAVGMTPTVEGASDPQAALGKTMHTL